MYDAHLDSIIDVAYTHSFLSAKACAGNAGLLTQVVAVKFGTQGSWESGACTCTRIRYNMLQYHYLLLSHSFCLSAMYGPIYTHLPPSTVVRDVIRSAKTEVRNGLFDTALSRLGFRYMWQRSAPQAHRVGRDQCVG